MYIYIIKFVMTQKYPSGIKTFKLENFMCADFDTKSVEDSLH